ncbi:hypothetical protein M405DRAFT_786041 [Rhizopogon salebrosus TDB-379]|nr:hypothetical protein M405DRAFT_786041 [Rhizopogon salebrosus TDB-379]
MQWDAHQNGQCQRTSQRGCLGWHVTKFRIQYIKTAPAGEEVYWAAQAGLSDPKAAPANHLRVNPSGPEARLFAWKHPTGGLRPLSRAEVTKHISSAATAAGLPSFKGYSLHIEGAVEYLLRGIPFDVVKSMGSCSSESFIIYLRQHATILAPYIQATPVLEPFTRYTMLPFR